MLCGASGNVATVEIPLRHLWMAPGAGRARWLFNRPNLHHLFYLNYLTKNSTMHLVTSRHCCARQWHCKAYLLRSQNPTSCSTQTCAPNPSRAAFTNTALVNLLEEAWRVTLRKNHHIFTFFTEIVYSKNVYNKISHLKIKPQCFHVSVHFDSAFTAVRRSDGDAPPNKTNVPTAIFQYVLFYKFVRFATLKTSQLCVNYKNMFHLQSS